MTVLVASTCAPYKLEKREEAFSWLAHAEAWKDAGHEFFLAAEIHAHMTAGRMDTVTDEWGVYDELRNKLRSVAAEVWYFAIDTGERMLTTSGRLARICTGRNLAMEYLCNRGGGHEAVLFIDTDVEPPVDAIDRLLEVDRQLVAFHVPTYCHDGPRVLVEDGPDHLDHYVWVDGDYNNGMVLDNSPFPTNADIREHWTTAGSLMVKRPAARRLRWRWDLEAGATDDPCFQADAVAAGFGQTWVRHDCVGQHHPGMVYPLEQRGHDLSL